MGTRQALLRVLNEKEDAAAKREPAAAASGTSPESSTAQAARDGSPSPAPKPDGPARPSSQTSSGAGPCPSQGEAAEETGVIQLPEQPTRWLLDIHEMVISNRNRLTDPKFTEDERMT